MAKKNPMRKTAGKALNRRQFLGTGVALGSGGLLASLYLSRYVAAQNAPAAGRPQLPPEPAVSQPPPLTDLKGKVAYITAASDGIGPLFRPGNAGVLPVKHDVTDREGWKRVLEQIKKEYGKLHLVVNNAGIKTLRPASKASYQEWDEAVAVNVTGIVNSVVVCLPHMLEHGEGGHFVAVSSMGGLLPGLNAGVYTATKIAAVGVMEALRVELESTNIGTSVFCPGGVNTDNYFASGQPNPNRSSGPNDFSAAMMDPLEAGERVLNGVVHNDLFILSHPEFREGMQERFDAIMASTPPVEEPIPQARLDYEARVLRCGIYNREVAHRKVPRKSYRTV
jgi:NAD(P)-dependent dehydrogenase (short-subunit alcohol dehydrogenase family)